MDGVYRFLNSLTGSSREEAQESIEAVLACRELLTQFGKDLIHLKEKVAAELEAQEAGRWTPASSSPRSSAWSVVPPPPGQMEEEVQRVERGPPPPPPQTAPPPPLPAPQHRRIAAPITDDDIYFRDPDGYVQCKLCDKYVDEKRLRSKKHLWRCAHLPDYLHYIVSPPARPAPAAHVDGPGLQ